MNANKILIAGVAGGIIFFLLGWLVYGILLMDFMSENAGPGAASIHKEPMEMWALVVSNFAWGFLFAIMFGRWSTGITPAEGAMRGAATGLLVALFLDMSMYAMSNILTAKTLVADIAAMTVIAAIGGWSIAFILRMGKRTA